jgi:hypothetical protein
MRPGLIAAGVLAAGLAVGCGSAPPIARVSGTVTAGGKAIRNVEVRFVPDGTPGGPEALGMTDAEGRYQLIHFDGWADRYRDGVVVGPCKVLLTDYSRPVPKEGERAAPRVIPDQYGDLFTTPLAFEVKPGANEINITVP